MKNGLARQNGIIAGVCGGLAARFNIPAFIPRILFILASLPGGVPGVLPYLVLWIVMPKRR